MFLLSLLTLSLGAGLCLFRVADNKPSVVKSSERYWSDTGLSADALEDLLQDQTCSSSERYFLACANSILTVASRFDLNLNFEGQLVSEDKIQKMDLPSEKKQLEPWKKYYSEHTAEAMKISFLSAWKQLQKKHIQETQSSMMIGLGLNGFISVFRDPHTYLMPVSQFKEVVSKADNQSTSLGIILGHSKGSYVIRKVTEGSPAKTAGLKKGDLLVSINGEEVKGLMQGRVSDLLRGDVGDMSTIRVVRDGNAMKFRLRRLEVTVPTVSVRVIDGIKPIAVVGINKFAKGSCEKTKEALQMVAKTHVRGLLLDLRDNPGGQMEEAACITGLFVGSDKKIFEIRYLDPSKKAEAYYGSEDKVFDKPVAVLVNAASASAAEIVAGALKDLNRAVLVGERTFGKGSFQEGEYWSQNKKVALFETKGFYYLPSGRSPQMKGLEPDVSVKFDEITVIREAEQFMNPLLAPERAVKESNLVYSRANCLDVEEEKTTDDLQLLTAKQVLFCGKAVAGARL